MDDDGTRFPIQYPEIQIASNSPEGIYRQELDSFLKGLSGICQVAPHLLQPDIRDELNKIFSTYTLRYPFETALFLHELLKVSDHAPSEVMELYNNAQAAEDQAISKGSIGHAIWSAYGGFSSAILESELKRTVARLKSPIR